MHSICARSVVVGLSVVALVSTLPGVAEASPEVQRPTPAGDAAAAAEPAATELPAGDPPSATGDPPPDVGAPPAEGAPASEPLPEAFPAYTPPPAYAAPPPYAPPPERVNPNRGMGLTIVGFSAWGMIYLGTVALGTINIDASEDPSTSEEWNSETGEWEAVDPGSRANMKTYGQRLLIPVAGPFLAIPFADSATASLGTAMLGVVQVAALTLGIAGAARLAKSRRQARFAFGTSPTRHGAMSTLRFAF